MSHYTKLWSEIVNSTIWDEDDQTRIVWITLLALSDAGGYVGTSVPGLAHQARVNRGACEKAIARLGSPDKDSRTHDHEGRRIKAVDGGFVILNYAKHREAIDEEIRRHGNAERQRRLRERRRNGVTRDVTQNNGHHAQAEAEAEAEAEARKNPSDSSAEPYPDTAVNDPVILEFPIHGRGPKIWGLTKSHLTRLEGDFPTIDLMPEIHKAHAWCEANPGKRKTARGMSRFVAGWLGRAQDRIGQMSNKKFDPAPDLDAFHPVQFTVEELAEMEDKAKVARKVWRDRRAAGEPLSKWERSQMQQFGWDENLGQLPTP